VLPNQVQSLVLGGQSENLQGREVVAYLEPGLDLLG